MRPTPTLHAIDTSPHPCHRLHMGRFFLTITIAVLALHPACANPNGFARLEDGTIVEIRHKTDALVTYRRADGTPGQVAADDVDGWLGTRQANTLVDRILPMVGDRKTHDEVRKQLKTLQMAAVPRIVHHLRTGDERRRMEAIAALQFVWSTGAEEAVRKAASDENETIRSIALRLIQTRIPGDHGDLLDEAARDADPHVRGAALHKILSEAPDPGRLAEALEEEALWPHLHTLLPRHHDRARFGTITHRMLDTGKPDVQASALCALIHQYDLDASTRAKVLKLLRDFDPGLRMRGAEYLRWHGFHENVPSLQSALAAETDLHCRAVMRAAIAAIGNRKRLFARPLSNAPHDWTGDFGPASILALKDWNNKPPSAGLRFATLELLGTRGSAPFVKYDGRTHRAPDDADGRYLALVNHATGYPGPARLRTARPRNAAAKPPVAATLVPPVRNYYDPQRRSFGLFTGDYDGPFKGSHHVGDDVAFHQQHETVVAIGDGIVRHARIAAPSWGGIVIIEHHDPTTGSPFCSLYSHLGPLVCVQAGDEVRKGDMLGSLGRTFTRATGGYQSHLHFGIHLTPFASDWITGYLSPQRFKDHDHAWTDPQPFIKNRTE